MALTKVKGHIVADDLALGGNPTTTTQSAGNNTTRIATTAFVTTAVANLVDGAPSTLNTLDEIAAALNDDAALNTTLTNSIATKLPLAGGTMTGTIAGFTSTGIDDNADATAITIDSSENVGIGTTSPGTALQVGDGTGSPFITIDKSTTGTSGILLKNAGSNKVKLLSNASEEFELYTNNALAMYVKESGHVGIGTNSPAARLHISGNSDVSDEDCQLIIDDIDGSAGSRIPSIQFRSLTSGTVTNQGRIRATDTQGMILSGSSAQENDLVVQEGKIGIGTTSPDDKLDIMGGGYDQIRIGSNKTDNTNKQAGIVSTNYANNSVSLVQGFFQNGSNALYWGSADGAHRGINQHYFMVNSNYNSTSGHQTALYIDSGAGIYMGGRTNSSFNNDGVYISNNNGSFIYLERSAGTSNSVLYLHRRNGDGSLIDFYESNNRDGYIQTSSGVVSLVGFGGAHDSSGEGISSSTPVGTVLSTIDAEHKEKHAKVKVSDSVGDKRVYGVFQEYKEEEESDTGITHPAHAIVAAVGIGSVRVTGACEGGDLLESNGDGTAKVQSDDIIKSKTIGKVTIGNSDTNVKLVSCVLYCG